MTLLYIYCIDIGADVCVLGTPSSCIGTPRVGSSNSGAITRRMNSKRRFAIRPWIANVADNSSTVDTWTNNGKLKARSGGSRGCRSDWKGIARSYSRFPFFSYHPAFTFFRRNSENLSHSFELSSLVWYQAYECIALALKLHLRYGSTATQDELVFSRVSRADTEQRRSFAMGP